MIPLGRIEAPNPNSAGLPFDGESITIKHFADTGLENCGLLGDRDELLGRSNKSGKCYESYENEAINHPRTMPPMRSEGNPRIEATKPKG